jgi:ribose transport system ATP-binding protein
MVGREIDSGYYMQDERKDFDASSIILNVENVTVRSKLENINLKLRKAEVICLVGTEGSGREAILRSVFGMETPDEGYISYFENRSLSITSPFEAVSNGVGYMPRERKIEGIFSSMDVTENMTSSQLDNYNRFGFLQQNAERKLAREWVDRLSIKTPSIAADCGRLSGGNQQKVVLAKWRSSGAKLMMLDHPTRGLDIGAKQDVYGMIREMSAAGIGLIVVPDTFEEAIGLAHTIIVMKDGKIMNAFDTATQQVTPFDLVSAMT